MLTASRINTPTEHQHENTYSIYPVFLHVIETIFCTNILVIVTSGDSEKTGLSCTDVLPE